jgi:hypothetical protein
VNSPSASNALVNPVSFKAAKSVVNDPAASAVSIMFIVGCSSVVVCSVVTGCVVGAPVVGATVVGATVVGASVVGATVVGANVVVFPVHAAITIVKVKINNNATIFLIIIFFCQYSFI